MSRGTFTVNNKTISKKKHAKTVIVLSIILFMLFVLMRTRGYRPKTRNYRSALTKTNSCSSSKSLKPKEEAPHLLQHSGSLKEFNSGGAKIPPKSRGGAHRRSRSHFTIEYHRLADLQKFRSPTLETSFDDLANPKTTASSPNTIDFAIRWRNISGRLTTTTPTNICGGLGIGDSNNDNNSANDNPVESMRKQLEKLEDISDRLPSNDAAYFFPYPFQDKCTH